MKHSFFFFKIILDTYYYNIIIINLSFPMDAYEVNVNKYTFKYKAKVK